MKGTVDGSGPSASGPRMHTIKQDASSSAHFQGIGRAFVEGIGRFRADGCRQELHCDNRHGPWAFVISLTDWDSRAFSGGETMLLSDTTLSFWSSFAADTRIERGDLMRLIEPHFNQLTVFDPRIPHGVREVHGTFEPTEARIVLHGWYTEPGATPPARAANA
jgi:hypothetical protein